MLKKILIAAALNFMSTSLVFAQGCPTGWPPYNLTNATTSPTADAGQLMSNFNALQHCFLGITNSNGLIGIGNTSPIYPLDISSTSYIALRLNGSAGNTSSNLTQIHFAGGKSGDIWSIGTDPANSGSRDFGFYDMSRGTALTLQAGTGNVGIGTVSPRQALDVYGSIALSNGGRYLFTDAQGASPNFVAQGDNNFVFYNTDSSGSIYPVFSQQMHAASPTFIFYSAISTPSDSRLKKDIEPVSGAISILKQIRPVRYNWRAKGERTVGQNLSLPEGERQIGFVAQELAKVVPEAVVKPIKQDDIYSIKEQNLIPLLVQAINEQQVEIEQLKAQISGSASAR